MCSESEHDKVPPVPTWWRWQEKERSWPVALYRYLIKNSPEGTNVERWSWQSLMEMIAELGCLVMTTKTLYGTVPTDRLATAHNLKLLYCMYLMEMGADGGHDLGLNRERSGLCLRHETYNSRRWKNWVFTQFLMVLWRLWLIFHIICKCSSWVPVEDGNPDT